MPSKTPRPTKMNERPVAAAQAQLSDGMIKAGILNGISTLHSPPTGSDSIPDEAAKLAADC
jgi:hypothetical protein